MLADDPNVLAFRNAATRYCALIRGFQALSRQELVSQLELALLELYTRVLALPGVEPVADDGLPVAVTADERAEVFRGLHKYLGDHAFYTKVDDPIERSADDVVDVALADDLADIFRDLSNGLAIWEPSNGAQTADIVWDWRYAFESHWGQHLVNALRAVHWMRHVHYLDSPKHPGSAV